MKKISMNSLNTLFAAIAENQKLYLPIEKGGQVDFYEWNENEKVRLDVLKTVRSAKDVFFPQVEDLIKFRMEGKSIEIEECGKADEDFVIFGVRGCDIQAFKVLDGEQRQYTFSYGLPPIIYCADCTAVALPSGAGQ